MDTFHAVHPVVHRVAAVVVALDRCDDCSPRCMHANRTAAAAAAVAAAVAVAVEVAAAAAAVVAAAAAAVVT